VLLLRADKAYDVELPAGEPVENAAAGVQAAYDAAQPDVVLVEPTPRNKILAGLLAAKLGTAVISDVAAIDGDTVSNMYFGGLASTKQKATGVKVYTVATCFADAEATGSDDVETIAYTAPEKPLVLRGTKEVPREGADLTKCDVVVGAGRGFGAEEDLQMARDLCAKVGGELGCSRPLAENVDWMPRNLYIGVSGLQLAPKAYFALGISGQMQHMVGVQGADTIIAINKDQNAPIFKQADYGLVGDIYKVLPALIEKL
jgi:electron transfer flavoprotein alpha subunit